MDPQLQSVLEETLNSFFLYDFSFNSLNSLVNRIPTTRESVHVPPVSHGINQEETKSESGDSLPDLIPIEQPYLTNLENENNRDDNF